MTEITLSLQGKHCSNIIGMQNIIAESKRIHNPKPIFCLKTSPKWGKPIEVLI